ncbi:MAG: twin-arginine translocation signal domain-containing protein [Burkholderiaceae bacterium]
MSQSKLSASKSSRRGFVTMSATAGAAVAAAAAVPFVASSSAVAEVAEVVRPKPERGGGYHASEHIKRYYKTTLI